MNSKKKLWIGIGIALAVVLVICLILLLTGKESYRVVKIYELDGSATVRRESMGEIEMYPNMVLQSGDEVYLAEGLLTLKLDEDKYVYVEEKTRFQLVASGNSNSGKTSIHLLEGAIVNEIQSPLAENASYEVHTQNSSMSVRGTVFRVEIFRDEAGILYTRVSVFDGKVETQLVYKDGTKADARMLEYGKETIIFEDEVNTDYLEGITDIKYETLPKSALVALKELVQNGLELPISLEKLDELLADDSEQEPELEEDGDTEDTEDTADDTQEDAEEDTGDESEDESVGDDDSAEDTGDDTTAGTDETPPASTTGKSYKITFVYDGEVFATQNVSEGGQASKPKLAPAPDGSWDFDFATAIHKDTEINWKE